MCVLFYLIYFWLDTDRRLKKSKKIVKNDLVINSGILFPIHQMVYRMSSNMLR